MVMRTSCPAMTFSSILGDAAKILYESAKRRWSSSVRICLAGNTIIPTSRLLLVLLALI